LQGGVYYEDLAVGQTFTSPARPISGERIGTFAAEFDPQPQHLDAASAEASIFGELVASGWHTCAHTMRLLVEGGMPAFAGGSMGRSVEGIDWPMPVRPGDTLHAVSELVEMRPSRSRPDRGIIRLRTMTLNQRGETVLVMTSVILVPRRV